MDNNLNSLEMMSKEELLEFVKKMLNGGITLSFNGKRTAQVIERKVMPRIVKIDKKLSFNDNSAEGNNIIIDGENLQAMVTLYKYKGQIDLIVTDPPYNTGKDFRYNDKWDTDPNDPDLGELVTLEDGSRHTKWMKFMLPRIQMMKAMLKPNGVLAICIDEREFFHLGMLLNEVFGEENRIGIINWQKSYSPKNDSKHVSTATEYVLVYAKDKNIAKTALLPRDEKMNERFTNPDNDNLGRWAGKDPTAKQFRKNTVYGIQSPFSGYIHYPEGEYSFNGNVPEATKHWTGMSKTEMQLALEGWGSPYVLKNIGDGRGQALVLKGSSVRLHDYDPSKDPVVAEANKKALYIKENSSWPKLIFLDDNSRGVGFGRPRIKNHLKFVKQGKVAMTYWADEDYDELTLIQFDGHKESLYNKNMEGFKWLREKSLIKHSRNRPLKKYWQVKQQQA
ncbi:site-specific DNA-methyltransferase [Ruminiclostridium josui]|uniref:site-specific DNA-methyltransferase n=1 Tax=Ruminiclostridium josui TaxID=1499 RepID=UPI000466E086|nr:site-specific DNA-methyltransferase [Ruminiclostridium josui]